MDVRADPCLSLLAHKIRIWNYMQRELPEVGKWLIDMMLMTDMNGSDRGIRTWC